MKYGARADPSVDMSKNSKLDWVRRWNAPRCHVQAHANSRRTPAQVETQLQTKAKEKKPPTPSESSRLQDQIGFPSPTDPPFKSNSGDGNTEMYTMGIPGPAERFFDNMALPNDNSPVPDILPDLNPMASPLDDGMTWEMIGLGLEEPLPTQEAIDELFVTLPPTWSFSC